MTASLHLSHHLQTLDPAAETSIDEVQAACTSWMIDPALMHALPAHSLTISLQRMGAFSLPIGLVFVEMYKQAATLLLHLRKSRWCMLALTRIQVCLRRQLEAGV